ncbi:MAG: hypothetical protein V7707_15630 [Motiliproteus sp.]
MKKISLPATNTISIPISLSYESEADENGMVYLGGVEPEDISKLSIARENGMHVIWSTVCLEKKLEEAITNFFFGKTNSPTKRRNIFVNEVLQSSSFQFSFKKSLISTILQETEILKGKESSKIQGFLRKIMTWRNAFAHGSMTFDTKKGVLLNYYSGGHKTIILDEEFWNEVETIFEKCNKHVEVLVSKL